MGRETKLFPMAGAGEEEVFSPVRQSHTYKVSRKQVELGKDQRVSSRFTVVQDTLY